MLPSPSNPVGVKEVYDFHEGASPGALWRDWGGVAWPIDLQRAVEHFAFCLALDPSYGSSANWALTVDIVLIRLEFRYVPVEMVTHSCFVACHLQWLPVAKDSLVTNLALWWLCDNH